ncbi:MFS transporter [Caulobacter sp. SLTY]|uniref:MFS transporter n=1 Tax=Caulobacter sp. SLTY TaxID=2683262 RepID=UPI001412F433|nr:MFS transporter [Caulobacter sp. SLTY]NBB15713.1 MFS transporter [Caulobacter sp. SLTY]
MTKPTTPAMAIGLCLLAAMLEGFDIASMGVAGPRMLPDLGLSPEEAGAAFSASPLGLFVGALMAGPFADRLGRKPVLLASVVVFGLFSIATAWVPNLDVLLLVRFLCGVGLGGAMPMLLAMSAELAGEKRKAFTVGLVTAGLPLGGALVGLLARTDAAQADWRLIFIVGGVAPLILAALLLFLLPETKAKSAEDVLTGDSLHALFGRDRLATTASLWISFAAIALVLHLFLNWLPILLGQRGVAPKDTAGIMTLFNIGGALGGLFAGWAIDRIGAKRPFLGIFLMLMLVLIVLSGLTGTTPLALMAFAAGFLIMAGQFGLYALAPQHYGEKVRGVGVGAAVSAGRLGSVFGPLVAGMLLGSGATSGDVVMSTVPIVAVAGLAALALTVWGRK